MACGGGSGGSNGGVASPVICRIALRRLRSSAGTSLFSPSSYQLLVLCIVGGTMCVWISNRTKMVAEPEARLHSSTNGLTLPDF
jgi:hypothetical protein